MKFVIHLLLIGALAVGPWGCNRGAPSESVSANADQTARSEKAEPSKARETAKERNMPRQQERQTATETRRTENKAVEAESRQAPPAAAPRARAMETVPSGTAMTVTLADAISTETNKAGDNFTAHLTGPLVVNGKVVAEKGDSVKGHVRAVQEPGKVKGRARLELVLDQITTSNHAYNISTEPFIGVAGSSKDRDAAIIAGGAGVGAVVGAVTGGKKGAALGAIIGGGTGTTAVLLTKGKQLTLEPETRVNFVLSKDVDLPVIRNATT